MKKWRGLMMMMIVILISIEKGEGADDQLLMENYYLSSCPNVEAIVKQVVFTKFAQTFVTIPSTLRLFFHDCFVTGCDASVMVASENGDAEKDAADNESLAGDGFDTIIKAKQALEFQCPRTVSCADIMAIAARDVVVLAGGPSFNIELGRRDGSISKASLVAGNLPEPDFNLAQLEVIFAKNNLTQTDMIALSGAHTVGFSHCNRFSNRLYSFSPSSPVDPSLAPDYAKQVMDACPRDVPPDIAIDLDMTSPRIFDNAYYQNLVAGKGLLASDQVLFTDSESKFTVSRFANSSVDFNDAFATAMVKLGRVGVKTGNQGSIRTDCTLLN
ncbi:Peroxidase family protein [Euphorbia peplus]|nr:Peroxidase family protein [Euphorbia peplus]